MYEVIYHSCNGNTRKVAEAIAETLGVTAQDVGTAGVVSPDAFIFLGMSCCRGVLPDTVKAFIHENRFRGRKIALFTTSAFGFEEERRDIEKQLEAEGAWLSATLNAMDASWTSTRPPTWLELKKAAWFARSAAITLFDRRAEKVEQRDSRRTGKPGTFSVPARSGECPCGSPGSARKVFKVATTASSASSCFFESRRSFQIRKPKWRCTASDAVFMDKCFNVIQQRRGSSSSLKR